MQIKENVSLGDFSTMRLGGKARYLAKVNTPKELIDSINWAKQNSHPIIIIGGGSNILWGDKGFNGLVIVNKIKRFEIFAEDENNAYITIGAGENWDEVVDRTVKLGYSGIEALSLIPGTAGATPVQNVGAYGQEISNVLTTVEAYDLQTHTVITLRGSDCDFSYRSSRFKTTDKGRYFIISIVIHVTREQPKPPFYTSLQSFFEELNIKTFSIQIVRDAVIAIRSSKLPNPDVVANNGSFFENPIVDETKLRIIKTRFPDVVSWKQDGGGYKISGAWMIEKVGLKDFHDKDTGMATWARQPLVLINEHAKSTSDALSFKKKIVDTVEEKFGVVLKQEPEYIEL